jgi:hypothetical protein
MLRFKERPEYVHRDVLKLLGGREELQKTRPLPFGDMVLRTNSVQFLTVFATSLAMCSQK